MYDYLFFDLDGTIMDSAPGIYASVRYALSKYGLEADERTLQTFVGPPLDDSFMREFGFSKEKADEAVRFYREYYPEKGIFEQTAYPGVPEALAKLRAAGRKVYLATSKPEPFAKRILDRFGLTGYFDIAAGASFDDSRADKDQVLRYLIAMLPEGEQAVDEGRVLMVGDRKYDVEGAKALGIPCLGVGYGYAEDGELAAAGAVAVAETAEEMAAWILEH